MPNGIAEKIAALRSNPRRATKLVVATVLALVLVVWAWRTRSTETWVEASPANMELTAGASQQLSVALKYKPRFRGRGSARSIAGTIQLISFPRAVDVAPTSLVTSGNAPEAALTVKGLRAGEEELVLAGSNTPTAERSWRTASVRVVVSAQR